MTRWLLSLVRSGGFILVADQAVVSFANLVATVLVAKSLSTSQFGSYSLLFTTMLIVTGVANAVVSEPVRIFGVKLDAAMKDRYASAQIILRIATSLPVATFAVLSGYFFESGEQHISLAFSVFCVATLFHELARAFNAAERQWLEVLVIDVICSVVRITGLYAMWASDSLTVTQTFLMMALGSMAGVAYRPLGKAVFKIPTFTQIGTLWQQNWRYGKWLALESLVFTFSTQIYVFVVASYVGLNAVGGLAAAQSVVNLLNLILIATTTNISVNSRYALMGSGYESWRTYLLRSGLSVVGLAVLAGALLIASADPLMRLLYTPEIAKYSYLVPLLAVGSVFTIGNSILNVAFRTAEMPKVGVAAKSVSALVTNIVAIPLVGRFEALGAAGGSVLTQLCWTTVFGYNIFVKRALSRENILRAVTTQSK